MKYAVTNESPFFPIDQLQKALAKVAIAKDFYGNVFKRLTAFL